MVWQGLNKLQKELFSYGIIIIIIIIIIVMASNRCKRSHLARGKQIKGNFT
jgi:hypothetical protein